MDATMLLQRLLTAKSKEERQLLLKTHMPLETTFFQLFKARSRKLVEEAGNKPLRATDVGRAAAAFAAARAGMAYVWWARGIAFQFLGQYDDCLAAYTPAISIFAGLGRTEDVAKLQTNCIPPLMRTGHHAEAQAMGQSALETLANQGDTRPVANLLLNLGICALQQGDHADAVAQIGQAVDIFVRLDNTVQAARCQVTQAVALRHLDRFKEAESLLREALQVFADRGAWVPWARTALNLGGLYARLTDYQSALYWLEESRRAFLKSGIEMDAAVVDLYRAQSFLDVGLLPEAAALGKELVETFTQLKMPRQVARVALLLAEVCTQRGQFNPARQELERARRIFCTQGDVVEVATIDLQRAALLREIGRSGSALRLASKVIDVFDADCYPLRYAKTHLIIAGCCEDLGRIAEAQVAYRVAWAAGSCSTNTTEPLPELAYHIAHARGVIAEAAGDWALAQGEYGRAVGYLTRITQGLDIELRSGYLADKRPVYEASLRLALEKNRVTDAFRYSELARASALRDFMGRGQQSWPQTAGNDQTTLEELKVHWAWRVSNLRRPVDLVAEAKKENVKSKDRLAQLRELADLERELADVYRRRRLANPRIAVLEQGQVLELDNVCHHLPDDTALISFDHIDDRLLAFVVTRDKADLVQLDSLSQLRWDAAGLGHALEEIRLFDDPADLALLEANIVDDLQLLYQTILAKPLARLGSDVRRLFIVPCDVLHTLPLEAFHDGQKYLLEQYTVSYLPAASILTALPQPHWPDAGSAVIMGDTWDGRLPHVVDEIHSVTQTLRKSPVGNSVVPLSTAESLREYASQAGLLHIATHGDFRSDAPLFSSLYLSDGPLTVNEVYDLNLSQVALVTLSGCQTGMGQGRGGEMLGLTHAFFFAGAPTLVASRWRVDDKATAQLMQDFYAALARGETVAEALRTAQLNTLAYRPHAGYWAAFAVWGRGFSSIFRDGDGGKTTPSTV